VERLWAIGKQVVFDIDVQGGLNLKAQFQNRALALFIQPPSLQILEERLRGRGTESEEQLKMRIEKAGKEMELADRFDGIILNDDLEKAVEQALEQVRNFLLQ
jgi:guanylate kinase